MAIINFENLNHTIFFFSQILRKKLKHFKMIRKVIGFNGSPRKGWYTDQLVQKCLEGAKSVGAEVKMYQVSDLKNIIHWVSCLSCKRRDKKYFGTCVLKDNLTPILKEIKQADALIFGSPVSYSDVTAALHPILERMWFSNSTYSKDGQRPINRIIKTAFLMPMNATEKQAKEFFTYIHYLYVILND